MHRISLCRACILLAALSSAQVLSQESASEDTRTDRGREETPDQAAVLERCATVPNATDISVLDDQHVYIRTRGSNHYLLTTEQCDRLLTAFVRREVELVPYGRRICQSDGSYLMYVDRGRTRTCLIEGVQRVESRAAAHELAAGQSPAVRLDPIEIDPDPAVTEAEGDTDPPR